MLPCSNLFLPPSLRIHLFIQLLTPQCASQYKFQRPTPCSHLFFLPQKADWEQQQVVFEPPFFFNSPMRFPRPNDSLPDRSKGPEGWLNANSRERVASGCAYLSSPIQAKHARSLVRVFSSTSVWNDGQSAAETLQLLVTIAEGVQ